MCVVAEGTPVLAGEPLVELTAQLPEGQIVEKFLLNQINFQTALASKTLARCSGTAGLHRRPRNFLNRSKRNAQ